MASPVYGTPTQNTLAILEPPSKICWGILAPCGAPLGELGIPRQYSSYQKCQSWLTCVTIWRACGALPVTFTEKQNHGRLCSEDLSSVSWWGEAWRDKELRRSAGLPNQPYQPCLNVFNGKQWCLFHRLYSPYGDWTVLHLSDARNIWWYGRVWHVWGLVRGSRAIYSRRRTMEL